MPGLEPYDWTQDMYGLKDCPEGRRPKIPLIVPKEEADKKYTHPNVLAKVLHYLDLKVSKHENTIAEIKKTLNDVTKKAWGYEIAQIDRTPVKEEHIPTDKPLRLNKITRDTWGAKPPRNLFKFDFLTHPIKKVHITYSTDSDTSEIPEVCVNTLRQIQTQHLADGLNDIAYNFMVAGDGQVYEGRGWYIKPEIASKNTDCEDHTLDIAFVGRFTKETCPEEYLLFTKDLLAAGINENVVSKDYKIL